MGYLHWFNIWPNYFIKDCSKPHLSSLPFVLSTKKLKTAPIKKNEGNKAINRKEKEQTNNKSLN